MISRKVNNVQEALEGIQDGMTHDVGWLRSERDPEKQHSGISPVKERTNLTCISNNAGVRRFRIRVYCFKNDRLKK